MTENKTGWTNNDEFDWDSIPDDAPAQLPDGLFKFKVVESRAEKTGGGHPGVKLTIEALEPFGGGDLGHVSRKVRDTVALTKDAAFRVKQLCKATGVKPPKTNSTDDMTAFAEDLLGTEGYFKCRRSKGRGENEGKEFANVGMYCTPEQAEAISKGQDPSAVKATSAAKRPPPRTRAATA